MEMQELITVVNEVAATLLVPIDLLVTLGRITRSAAETIPGIEYASISVTSKDGRIETLAPTDLVAVQADELQYELCEGPCYAAVTGVPVVQVDDLASDLRWPEYGPRAAAAFGLGSQLAFQFHAEPHARGALNLYATRAHEIDTDTRQLGAMFARLVAVALGWARHDENLSEALHSRQVIGQAVGIVMERYRLDPDRAFAFLVRVSQTANVKLREVAAGVIADTFDPVKCRPNRTGNLRTPVRPTVTGG
ncbi:GAF and ANTAR domain-containing protein [Kribbella sp. NPDC026611]|uniref:GAF and ANTAR domain-containing protein n=1 Tax=Kribbella sp. NPDC026611 TaxID=3154911 RepID=UPI0033EB5BC5